MNQHHLRSMRICAVMAIAVVAASGDAVAQDVIPNSCPPDQRLEARIGFESFDCEGCKLRRDPETGMAYVEFTKAPVLRGVGTTGALRDGDVLTHVDSLSILTPVGARRLAALQRSAEARFTVRRNNVATQVTLAAESFCRPLTAAERELQSYWYSMPNATTRFSFSARGDSLFSQWNVKPNVQWSTGFSFRRDTLTFQPKLVTADKAAWSAGFDSMTFKRNQAWSLPNASYNLWYQNALMSVTEPQGWFGFSLGCDNCSFGNPADEYVYALNAKAATSRTVRLWRFSKTPQIVSVDSGGPADQAGLRVGDVLTAIDGLSITTAQGGQRFSIVQPGDTVTIQFARGAQAGRTARLVVSQHPSQTVSFSRISAADVVLKAGTQGVNSTVEISGSNIMVTEDPKTGERTITGTNVKIVIKPPKPPGG